MRTQYIQRNTCHLLCGEHIAFCVDLYRRIEMCDGPFFRHQWDDNTGSKMFQ